MTFIDLLKEAIENEDWELVSEAKNLLENEEFEELDGTEKIKSISLAQNSINEQAKLKEINAASSINLESILPEGLAQEVEERVPSLLERP